MRSDQGPVQRFESSGLPPPLQLQSQQYAQSQRQPHPTDALIPNRFFRRSIFSLFSPHSPRRLIKHFDKEWDALGTPGQLMQLIYIPLGKSSQVVSENSTNNVVPRQNFPDELFLGTNLRIFASILAHPNLKIPLMQTNAPTDYRVGIYYLEKYIRMALRMYCEMHAAHSRVNRNDWDDFGRDLIFYHSHDDRFIPAMKGWLVYLTRLMNANNPQLNIFFNDMNMERYIDYRMDRLARLDYRKLSRGHPDLQTNNLNAPNLVYNPEPAYGISSDLTREKRFPQWFFNLNHVRDSQSPQLLIHHFDKCWKTSHIGSLIYVDLSNNPTRQEWEMYTAQQALASVVSDPYTKLKFKTRNCHSDYKNALLHLEIYLRMALLSYCEDQSKHYKGLALDRQQKENFFKALVDSHLSSYEGVKNLKSVLPIFTRRLGVINQDKTIYNIYFNEWNMEQYINHRIDALNPYYG